MPDNPVRNCVICGQSDTDPRHVVVLADQSEAPHHMDCASRLNPPCALCVESIRGADGATGKQLRTHLTSGKAA